MPSPNTVDTAANQKRTSGTNYHSGSPQMGSRAVPAPLKLPQLDRTPNSAPSFVPGKVQDGATPWPTSSDDQNQLGSPGARADRVFPVSSVVSVDPSQVQHTTARQGTEDQIDNSSSVVLSKGTEQAGETTLVMEQHNDTTLLNDPSLATNIVPASQNRSDSGRFSDRGRMQLFSDASSEASSERMDSASFRSAARAVSIGKSAPAEQENPSLLTARFKHIVTAEGHAVITGRDGESIQRCEDEPIHIPGAVQAFGLLVALEEVEGGHLLVRVVSENSRRIIGYHPADLFKLESFTEVLSEEEKNNLFDHIDFIRDEDADPDTNSPDLFTIVIQPPASQLHAKKRKLWCAMHVSPSQPNLIICEFELDNDEMYPLAPTAVDEALDPPQDTLNCTPTEEELEESTKNMSKPLRVLRSARKKKGEAAAMEVFNVMAQVQEQLASAPNLESLLKVLVGVIRELTGFHRVMIYQFDSQFNGRVVTELVDPRATKDLYKGLNFPASDIPKQARDLYKINKVRLLYDRDLESSRLVCRTVEDLERPLDLSLSYLRAMSPIHIKYLVNMAVRSSMSISINAFGDLWGLIACHSYGSKGMRVSFPIRKMCRLIGDTASRNIERLSYAARLQARKLINTSPTETNPSGYIIASSDELLKLFDADFGLLSIRGETKVLGKFEQTQEALAMLEYLRLRKITSVITSQDIKEDFRDLRYPPGFAVIAGLLLVPLSVGGGDFIVFLRKAQIREVRWAGNPYEKSVKTGTQSYLEPRKSFKSWSETVVGKCREWTEEQVETAAVLCLVYGKFIEVWRQKEAAMQNSQLTRLLLANSAHEVRTPLNAIINYLEIALEGAVDDETRDNLAKSYSASKSLICVINDLLDLTKTEEGQDLIKDELFDLPATIRDATDSFTGDAKRKGIEYELIEHPGLPQFVYGDQRRVRQVVANITANAIQHTTNGFVRVELWLNEILDGKATVEIVVEDSGSGMSNEQLDALFADLEQVTTDPEESNSQLMEGQDNRTLGLGLATVARLVRNMDGQLRLKSEEGVGSRFVIQLPFALPTGDGNQPRIGDGSALSPAVSNGPALVIPPPAAAEGEVTLVTNTAPHRSDGGIQKYSIPGFEDGISLNSFESNSSKRSAMSDVDRLIDAISGPLSLGDHPGSDGRGLQRSSSRSSDHSRRSTGSLGSPPSGVRASMSHEKPSSLSRSKSYGASGQIQSTLEKLPGSESVTDNRTLMKAVKVPEDSPDRSTESSPTASGALRHRQDNPRTVLQDASHFQILVAEDDPINSRIIKKRLEKSGHDVYHAVNGEECASAYRDNPGFFDVVLMDMQMPIVDGLSSTKMIRSFEKSKFGSDPSSRASVPVRVPVLAVSASLVERERQTYIDAGFDGWVLKPIDFKRLSTLLTGIVDDITRDACLYHHGEWDRGGWFDRRQPSMSQASILSMSFSSNDFRRVDKDRGFEDSGPVSESGSVTPINEQQ